MSDARFAGLDAPDRRQRCERSTSPTTLTAALAMAALLAAAPGAADDVFVVDSVADLVESDPVDIHCQTVAGTCTLRAAVMQANLNPGNTTIVLPPGLFALSRLPTGPNGADSGDLNLTKASAIGSITIQGAGAAATIIDGGDLDRIFRSASGSSTWIREVTVRNGTADLGGGIFVEGELTLTGVRITSNVATQNGGGINVNAAAPVIVEFSDIEANQATLNGGGIYLGQNADGALAFSYGRIRDNVAQYGGGLYDFGSTTLSIHRSSVSGNEAQAGGGFVLAEASAVVRITSSTIDHNLSTSALEGSGGGIFNLSTLSVIDSTISANTAALDGGGIYNLGTATLYSSTVAFNEADVDADVNGGLGGGVRSDPSGTFAIRNSVLAGNIRSGAPIADDCSGNVGGYGHNRLGSFAGCTVTHTGGCGGMDQLLGSIAELGPLRYNGGTTPTHAIEAGSGLIDDVDPPCICQDDFADPILFDQRGGPRVSGARCDVGAYELGSLPAGSLFSDGFESGGPWLWD